MGCLNSKEKPVVIENNHYSWSNKDKVDPDNYTIANAKYASFMKRPGDISGQQFIVENCEFTNIALFDYINTITIDDCNNCSIFIGPTIGSVVLRNCISCRIMCCSQQFRARDCRNMDIFVYCATQPAIESCYELTFGCFSAFYNGIEDHFKKANLCVLNNNWSNVYDFTVNDEEIHWSLFSKNVKAEDFFSGIPSDESICLSFSCDNSVVPKTVGSIPTATALGELALILVIGGEQSHNTAIQTIKRMQNESEIFLMKTKEFYAITQESQLMFGVESNQKIIALLYKGRDCAKKSEDFGKGLPGLLVFNNPITIYKQISIIFSNINN